MAEHGKQEAPHGADPERAFERLAENEALRRDWEDASYGPLLGWMANLAVARGALYGSTDDLYLALRDLAAGVLEAATAGDLAPLVRAAKPPLISAKERAALGGGGLALTPDRGRNVTAIVGRLAAITGIPVGSGY